MGINPTLNIPQARFLAMQHKFKAYVAGFGSGKTWVGCGGICKGMWEYRPISGIMPASCLKGICYFIICTATSASVCLMAGIGGSEQ